MLRLPGIVPVVASSRGSRTSIRMREGEGESMNLEIWREVSGSELER